MAEVNEIRSLALHQLLGAPVLAFVQAQTHAMRATAEYIEKVGFDHEAKAEATGRLGALRLVSFLYRKPDSDGKLADFVVQVPALSLFPIPLMEIRHATIDLGIRVTDAPQEPAPSPSLGAADGWLGPTRTELRGTLAPLPSAGGPQPTPGNLAIHMVVHRSDLPVGLAKLLQTLDGSIQDRQVQQQG